MMKETSKIMTVLPPKEGFSADCVGAIGLLIRRLAQPQDLIVGRSLSSLPFAGLRYLEAPKSWYACCIKNKAYCYGVARLVKQYQPCLVEIHNRPEIALYIARHFPMIPVSLTLHNDPLSMRGLKTIKERQDIIQKIHVVAVSQWIKDRFLSNNVGGSITILSNHINFKDLPQYVPINEREKTILFVGRVVADKGVDIFVSICQKLLHIDPTWNIEIIGADRFDQNSPDTAFTKKINQQIQNTQIKMKGYLPYDQVLQRISVASAVIMPSRWAEPFGMTALEAMACGTPLLASSVGALPQITGNSALLINPDDLEDAFKQLMKLILNPNLQEKLSFQEKQRAHGYNSVQALEILNRFRQSICPTFQVK